MYEYTSCDGIMIGRGALGRPFFFTQVRDFLEKGEYYLGEAFKILQAGEKAFVDYSPEQDALVLKGTLRYPHREENLKDVEVPIIYGDFYFVEAMLKLKGNDFLMW